MTGPDPAASVDQRLAETMLALLGRRGPTATICPSEASRAVGGEAWRDLMDAAREAAAELSDRQVVTVLQRGREVDLANVVGPVRVGRGPRFPG